MRRCENLDVKFKTSMSKVSNCICNACHAEGTVMKLTFPVTKFHDRKNLSAKYYQFWLCEKCRAKLSFALEWPDDRPWKEEKKGEPVGLKGPVAWCPSCGAKDIKWNAEKDICVCMICGRIIK